MNRKEFIKVSFCGLAGIFCFKSFGSKIKNDEKKWAPKFWELNDTPSTYSSEWQEIKFKNGSTIYYSHYGVTKPMVGKTRIFI
jgi:hypothetical protein